MITVLRGPAAALDAHCARLAAASGLALPLFPPPAGGAPRCWNGVRNLLDGVARQRSRSFVASVLARRPDASSLVPGWFAEAVSAELSIDDRTGQALFAARPTSHLSHNLLIQRPLFQVWAELLHEILEGGGFTLLVSDLARLDRESLSALRALYRRFPETAPDLVVGYDPHRADPAPDADGLVWESPAEDVWRIALGFRALAGAQVVDLAGGKDDKDSRDGKDGNGAGPVEPAEDTGIDTLAWEALAASPELLAAEQVELVVEAMRTAFRCFGFTTVVRLGLELLRRDPHLTPEQAAEVHGLLGLAAHNRQFLSRRNRVLADFLERHFRAALETETDPARRSCLCYRLAVTFGRRKGEPAAALEWAERALAAAAPGLPSVQAAHLQVWAHNIEALALLRSGRPAEARFRCQQAFALLDRALESFPQPATAPDQLVREAAFTHSLLADNLAALAKMEGDAEGLAHWKEIADRLGEHFPGLARFEAVTWIEIFRERRELSQALAHAEHGLEDARAEQDALREYEYEVQVADLHDRLGEAAEAYEAFERARDLRRRLGSPRFLRPLDAPAATAAARAGKVVEARALYEALLAEGGTEGGRAQILAALAELAARTNKPEEADVRMNEAIALAVASGERDALLSVAVTAGRTCRVLGREAEEREAYRRAVDIAGAGGAEATAAPAGLLLSALLGAWETERDPDLALRAIRLLPEALEDASTWWELPRLLRALREAAPRELPAGPLQDLQAAAAQRADCAAALAELRGVLS